MQCVHWSSPIPGYSLSLVEFSYIPIVFTLHPGQMVLIGTGRLHCFRKMSHDVLPECDAHHDLRQAVLAALKPGDTTLCVSIAYDWYDVVSLLGVIAACVFIALLSFPLALL
jgi:hypothetical protein